MKSDAIILLLCVFLYCVGCQPNGTHLVFEIEEPQVSDSVSQTVEVKLTEVDASCGQCQFGMPGDGCDLAVKIEDVFYYVDGSSIDGHGDAHANDGLCNCVRKAIVSGKIIDGRFVASELTLVEVAPSSSEIQQN
jgi:hypothetical protein